MQLQPFKLHTAQDLAHAARLWGEFPMARFLAGGTFLINRLRVLKKKGLKSPDHIISLRRAQDLSGLTLEGSTLKIGPMTTLNELAKSPNLPGPLNVLRDLCQGIATTPIRNMATIGGNLTSRYTWAECGTVLIALSSQLCFVDAALKKQTLSCEDFFQEKAKAPGLLTEIQIPFDDELTTVYRRVPRLSEVDVPLLAVCVSARVKNNTVTHPSLIVNTADQFPQRAATLEKALNNRVLADLDCQATAALLDQDILGHITDDYKKERLLVEIEKALRQLKEKST